MRDEKYGNRNDAQEFRRRMASNDRRVIENRSYVSRGASGRNPYKINNENYRLGYKAGRSMNTRPVQAKKYKTANGTAYRAREKARKQAFRTKLKIATLLVAAGIGIGGFTYASAQKEEPQTTVTELQQMGYNWQSLGMSRETIEKMKEYDDFFQRFSNADKGQITITDNEIIDKLHDIEELNSIVIQEKMARLDGVSIKDVSIDHGSSSDIGDYVSIRVDKDGRETTYNNNNGIILGLGKENNLPEEITDLIFQLNNYSGLEEELKRDDISKYKAISEMKKFYGNISELATKTLLKDEKGNISLMNYMAKDKTMEKEHEEKEI